MNQELPQISSAVSASTAYSGDKIAGNTVVREDAELEDRRLSPQDKVPFKLKQILQARPENKEPQKMVSLRLVKVLIVDPDERLPLESRLLHESETKLTDLTDQELFFELDMKELLSEHNATRASTVDKKASEKTGNSVKLDPIRIRDLRMVVCVLGSV